jgi:hypothetical protein
MRQVLERFINQKIGVNCEEPDKIRGGVVTAVVDGFFTVFLTDIECHVHIPFHSVFEILESKKGIKGSYGNVLYPLVVQLHHPGAAAAAPRSGGGWWMGVSFDI